MWLWSRHHVVQRVSSNGFIRKYAYVVVRDNTITDDNVAQVNWSCSSWDGRHCSTDSYNKGDFHLAEASSAVDSGSGSTADSHVGEIGKNHVVLADRANGVDIAFSGDVGHVIPRII